MKKQQETFASCIKLFEYRYDLRSVFDDFLTMSTCALSPNPLTRQSHDEELYLQTIEKYKDDKLRFEFPKMFAALTDEMDERFKSDSGNDVLGEFYEQHLYRKGAQQYFTPWHVCRFMAACTVAESALLEENRPIRTLDPCCGSGRMLLAVCREIGQTHDYFGIDLDHTCVKMSAINLFLNGMFHSEALCADALIPEDFKVSYKISFLPFGIFRIQEKENSRLWHLLKNSWPDRTSKSPVAPINFEDSKPMPEGDQLIMF